MLWHFIGLSIALDILARTALESVVRTPEATFQGTSPLTATAAA
jgi:hypothetical protein